MDLLLGFTVAAIICTGLIIKLMLWLMNKTANAAITAYFQAAEHILDHHHVPPQWLSKQSHFLKHPLGSLSRSAGRKQNNPKQLILEQMDDLIRFFEHCTFFQDEIARTELLQQLSAERKAWEQAELKHIVGKSR